MSFDPNYVFGEEVDLTTLGTSILCDGAINGNKSAVDYSAIIAQLTERLASEEDKIMEYFSLYMQEERIVVNGCKEEEARLKKRRDEAGMKIETIMETIKQMMSATGIHQLKCALATYKWTKGPGKLVVHISEDYDKPEYDRFKKTKVEWDRAAIKEAMKDGNFMPHPDEFEIISEPYIRVS